MSEVKKVAIEMIDGISGKKVPSKLQTIHGSNGRSAKELGWHIFVDEESFDKLSTENKALREALERECSCTGERSHVPPYDLISCDPCEALGKVKS